MSQVQVQEQKVPILPPPSMYTERKDNYVFEIKGYRCIIVGARRFAVHSEIQLTLKRLIDEKATVIYEDRWMDNIRIDDLDNLNIEELAKAVIEMEADLLKRAEATLEKLKMLVDFAIRNNLAFAPEDDP